MKTHCGTILVTTLLAICGVAIVLVVLWWTLSPNRFPITDIRIHGSHDYVNADDIQAVLQNVGSDNFFTLNLDKAKSTLIDIDWIQWAELKRSWPGRLDVTLVEQVPVAIWNGRGLLNGDGVLFAPQVDIKPFIGLPQLTGGIDEEQAVWTMYMDMNMLLGERGIAIDSLDKSSQGSYEAVLHSGIRLRLGRSDILKRLGRYVDVHQRFLSQQQNEVAYIDLRYDTGVALGWKIKN